MSPLAGVTASMLNYFSRFKAMPSEIQMSRATLAELVLEAECSGIELERRPHTESGYAYNGVSITLSAPEDSSLPFKLLPNKAHPAYPRLRVPIQTRYNG